MIMRMDFSPEALNDLESIRDYLLAEYGVKTSEENIKKVMKSIRSWMPDAIF